MKVIAIVGPTAVGKTALAIELAKRYNGEIISCDSMQVYKGMDIGTAKPTREEMAQVKHHLINIKEPNESFSCADYAALAKKAIADIEKRGKTPIFCGGTGLYLDSVIEIPSFCETAKDEGYRQELEKMAREQGNESVHALLCKIDPESAEATHPNNVKRVIRALEIFKCTGVTKSEWDRRSREAKPPYEATVLFLTCEDREEMYRRIDSRVDIMMAEGLMFEVRGLYEAGLLDTKYTSSGAIGYKELLPVFTHGENVGDCVAELKTATRHYAKRQLTWFNKKKSYHKIYVDKENPIERAMEILGDFNG
ncbi:MAG: tRNA (adenosine(37)-N6)-dimethylallyltransferase MiaA [Clostridia bacterium]|nr:tRNA (adenosine(37)-N6)-dimethylallyltransferase MiaA [Clostridia bacterium]